MTIIYGGLKIAMIPVLYGFIIYLISLVVKVIQKPRLKVQRYQRRLMKILNIWDGFKEVVRFIDDNKRWLNVVLPAAYLSS